MNTRTIVLLPLVAGLFAPATVRAQQDPLFALYMWNTLAVDPAYAGSADVLSVTALARQQWVGLDGAPRTQTLTAHAPLPLESLGVGFSAVHDRTGPVDATQVFGDVAYRLRVSANARLAFGLKAGVEVMQVRLASLMNVEPDDPLFQQDVRSRALPNFGFGLYYWTERGFIGLSAPKLIERDRLQVDGTGRPVTGVRQARHYFLMAGYVFDLGENVKFHPWTVVRAVEHAPLAVDITASFLLREKLWLGASYRHPRTAAGFVAYQITPRFKVGYAYESTWGALRSRQSGTHEVMLNYDLPRKKEKTLSPRYF